MKKRLLFTSFFIIAAFVLMGSVQAHAAAHKGHHRGRHGAFHGNSHQQFNHYIQVLHVERAKMEAKLGLTPSLDTYPNVPPFEDHLVAHYEKTLIMKDEIDAGIR